MNTERRTRRTVSLCLAAVAGIVLGTGMVAIMVVAGLAALTVYDAYKVEQEQIASMIYSRGLVERRGDGPVGGDADTGGDPSVSAAALADQSDDRPLSLPAQ